MKEWNEFITDRYENIQIEINNRKEERDNIERKYKGMIKQIKNKEKDIKKENKDLKKLINNQENNNKTFNNGFNSNNENSQLNKTMFNSPINNNILNDNSNSMMIPKIEDPNDGNQKKILEEFKDLLKQMDERLEMSHI